MKTTGRGYAFLVLITISGLLMEVKTASVLAPSGLIHGGGGGRLPIGPGGPGFPIGPGGPGFPIGPGGPGFPDNGPDFPFDPENLPIIDFGLPDYSKIAVIPPAVIPATSSISSTSSVGTKSGGGKGDGIEVFVKITAASVALLAKSIFHWFGGKKSFEFLDTRCYQKTWPYINRLQLRYKSEFECNGYTETGYGRSANRRRAADEAIEDFLNKTNEKTGFKKSVVDKWLKSHSVPTPKPATSSTSTGGKPLIEIRCP